MMNNLNQGAYSPTITGAFIKGWAPGKLTGCEQDLAINLPGCFHLLFLLSFITKTKNAQLKNSLTSCTTPGLLPDVSFNVTCTLYERKYINY